MSPSRIGLVFPGQGTQREGMGEPWRETASWRLVEEISEHSGTDVEELLLRTSGERLRRTDLAQIAVYSVAMMAHAEAERAGLLTDAVACAGHSLGEYAALTAAGILELADGVALVTARGRAMREAAAGREGTMGVLVRAGLAEAEELVAKAAAEGHAVWVANVNGPGQIVLSGTEAAIEYVAGQAPEAGAKLIRVAVGGAFHSPLMEPAAGQLPAVLRKVRFAPGRLPVVANVDGEPYAGDADWPALAVRQLVSPVQWERSVHTLTGTLGCRRLLELGPGRTLAGLIKRIAPDVDTVSFDRPDAVR
ncbi:ACP S-malonyltransferase [Streptomyces scopuliridis]|uniref:ACP S-malonyltransferase n=1 Tax=Streptomyces scopuliridis TaxID=452529 RepID=UPI00369C5B80